MLRICLSLAVLSVALVMLYFTARDYAERSDAPEVTTAPFMTPTLSITNHDLQGGEEVRRVGPLVCGVERWTVKTLQDNPKLHLRAKTTTVVALDGLVPPSPLTGTRQPGEYQVYRLAGVTLDRFKLENDNDIHLGVTQAGAHLIIEFPNPACAPKTNASLLARLSAARAALVKACGDPPPGQIHSTALHKGTATITGVLFFDYPHAKFVPFDAAPNAAELHPALSFKLTSARC